MSHILSLEVKAIRLKSLMEQHTAPHPDAQPGRQLPSDSGPDERRRMGDLSHTSGHNIDMDAPQIFHGALQETGRSSWESGLQEKRRIGNWLC